MNKKFSKLLVLSLSLLVMTSCAGGESTNSSSSQNQVNSEVPSNENVSSSTSSHEHSTTPEVVGEKVVSKVSFTGDGDETDGTKITPDKVLVDNQEFSCNLCDSVYYSGNNDGCVKLGSSSKLGTLSFTSEANHYIDQVKISMKSYKSDKNSEIKVKLSNGEELTKKATSSYTEYVYDFKGENFSSFFEVSTTHEKNGRTYIESIEFTSRSTNFVKPDVNPDIPLPDGGGESTHPEGSKSTIDYGAYYGGDYTNPDDDPYKGDYYQSINTSLTGDALISSLHELLKSTHHTVSYDGLLEAYRDTDVRPNSNNMVWDMYSNCDFVMRGDKENHQYKVEGDGYNREHSVPQSWFSERSPMKSDIYHVVPTDGKVNNMRSNYPFGEVVRLKKESGNGSKLGYDKKGALVFEPIDEVKGDFARIYFYMVTRYYHQVGSWGGGVFTNNYPYINNDDFEMYVNWAIQDPVSTKEMQRNVGGEKNQHNRNPYVDHPSFFYKAFLQK